MNDVLNVINILLKKEGAIIIKGHGDLPLSHCLSEDKIKHSDSENNTSTPLPMSCKLATCLYEFGCAIKGEESLIHANPQLTYMTIRGLQIPR